MDTPTGRIVRPSPNLQQIPVRTPEGAAIKAALLSHLKIGDTPMMNPVMREMLRATNPPLVARGNVIKNSVGEVIAITTLNSVADAIVVLANWAVMQADEVSGKAAE